MDMNKKFMEGDWWDWPLHGGDGIVHVTNTGDTFSVSLEAKDFGPKECHVAVVGDYIEVNMEHEKGSSRAISRCYRLPKDVDRTTIKSMIDKEGHLNICAAKKH